MTCKTQLSLEDYIPYRLALLSGQIGLTGSRLYKEYFGFGLREWRIIAVLGRTEERSLSDLSRMARIDTGTATRALAVLHDRKLVEKREDGNDQRKFLFKLSSKGIGIYQHVVAGAIEREKVLTEKLSQHDRSELMRIVGLLDRQAKLLESFDPYEGLKGDIEGISSD